MTILTILLVLQLWSTDFMGAIWRAYSSRGKEAFENIFQKNVQFQPPIRFLVLACRAVIAVRCCCSQLAGIAFFFLAILIPLVNFSYFGYAGISKVISHCHLLQHIIGLSLLTHQAPASWLEASCRKFSYFLPMGYYLLSYFCSNKTKLVNRFTLMARSLLFTR